MIRQIIALLILLSFLSVFGKAKNADAPMYTAKPALYVTVTAYSPTKRECDDTPFITAFNKKVKTGTIAISRDMEKTHGWRKGDMIHLEGIGTFEVWDRMNKRWEKAVDIFFHDTRQAREFGRMQAKAEKL